MKKQVKKVSVLLRGHYDQDKQVVCRVDYNGADYYITSRAYDLACRRACIISGDYLSLDDPGALLVIEDEFKTKGGCLHS